MRRVLTIEDHAAFQLSVARTTLAGGAMLLAGVFFPSGRLYVALYGALLVLALLAAALPPRTLRQAALILCGGLLGAIFATPLSHLAARLPQAFATLDWLPGETSTLLGGLGLGLIVGTTTLVRHLRLRLDPMDDELMALLPATAPASDEISPLVTQAIDTLRQSAEALSPHPQALSAAEELVKKIARFGKRWREIEEQARRTDRVQLEKRLGEIQARRESTKDEQAQGEYDRAISAVGVQLDYLNEIDRGRERAVARLHHQVATLERLRLAVVRHHSVDAARQGEELRSVVEDLGRAGQELDTAAEALSEAPV
jgi:hypothetical protein